MSPELVARSVGVKRPVFLLVALACVFGLFAGSAGAQISPGPLSKAHQSLSGPANCTKCHGIGRGVAQLKCLECHAEIRERVEQRRGMHAVWVPANGTSKDCVHCHSEHNGIDFPEVRWEPSREKMDHSKTGFALTGRHAAVTCSKCHFADNIIAAARPEIKVKNLNQTYLGLSRECLSCHKDEHRGQLGKDCARCHNTVDWKVAPGFDHAAAKFPLTGAHEKVACAKCHQEIPDAKPYVKYTGIAFAKCNNCHNDPHKGAFAAPCQSCHSTVSWMRVSQLQGFDHAKTKFPLLGAHQKVGCEQCHTRGDFKTPVAFAKCTDCHKDHHSGQFLSRADGGDCASCHTVEAFKPSTFTLKEHAASKYPLEGKHATVACDQCHIPKGERTIFVITQTQCKDCHKDIHNGQFAGAPFHNQCEACHNVRGFKTARFTLARHKETRFPLTGAHVATPCVECHKPAEPGSSQPVKFRFEDRACTVCHVDPHNGQFRSRMEAKRADGSVAGCEACHSTSAWSELSRFDHAKTDFPLVGAHRGVECIDCHRPPQLETTLKNVDFKAASKECSVCHEDPHAGQFKARKDVADCSSCHTTARWKPVDFDHNKRSTFSLLGAHSNVTCRECHKTTREFEGKAVVFYKETPSLCKDCHGEK